MRMPALATSLLLTLLAGSAQAQAPAPPSMHDEAALIAEAVAEFENSLRYRTGVIDLGAGLAELRLPRGFVYLAPDDTRRVLEEAWGNPDGEGSLGMVLPAGVSPLDFEAWGIVIGYMEEGHVSDQDAGRLRAGPLLDRAREIVTAENAPLVALGFPGVDLAGWADPPRYDRASRQLVWARELRFDDAELATLNYSVRILGRTGVLVLDAVATLDRLSVIRDAVDTIRRSIGFAAGHAYADFDPGLDPLAGYGLEALVLGATEIEEFPADGAPPARRLAAAVPGHVDADDDSFPTGRFLAGGAGLLALLLAGVWLGRWSRGAA